jgi:hypothetical protein
LVVAAAAVSATAAGFGAAAGAALLSAAGLGAGAGVLSAAGLGAGAGVLSAAGLGDDDPVAGADGAEVTLGAAPAASATLVAALDAGAAEPVLGSVAVTSLMLGPRCRVAGSVVPHSVTAGGFAQPRPHNRCFLGTT